MDSTKMKCEMFVECQNMESHINSEKPQKALSESWKENSIVLGIVFPYKLHETH